MASSTPPSRSTDAGATDLFGRGFISRLERLRLVSRRLVSGAMKGEHRSHKRGSGIEFADYRPYVEGDSLRHVDWPAYLRFDKLLVRQFEEEGDMPVYLLLDCSESMAAPIRDSRWQPDESHTKFDFARRIIAACAYLGLGNLDRIILAGFANGLTARSPALRGTNQIHRAFRFLESLETGAATNLESTLHQFFNQPRRRGLVVVVSDFLHDQGAVPLAKLAGLEHDVLAVRVLDHRDLEPRLPRRAHLIDAETGQRVLLEEQRDRNEIYAQLIAEHAQDVRDLCRRKGWSFVEASTEAHFDDFVLDLMRSGHLRR